ncbi:MAG: L,D-transpeptidase [Anaerolineaceae bacterium]|nr:L,D-transpeptidase [Anaerolineaceae bacterium]
MKNKLLLLLLILTLLIPTQTAHAEGEEPKPGEVLCPPGVYLNTPENCLPLGPSQALTELAHQGILLPLIPLPAASPDPALIDSDLRFAKLNVDAYEPVALYGSPEDSANSANPINYIPAGETRYISYNSWVDINGGHYLQRTAGGWVRASPTNYSPFQGLVFSKTPERSFGWIVESTRARTAPGYAAPEADEDLYREEVVSIYSISNVDGVDWYMIGLNLWVERRYIRQVRILEQAPQGVDNNRWIDVNLYDQTLSVYQNGELVFASLIATGADPYYTQPGLFRIYEKKTTETMTGAFSADRSDYYQLEDVPWTMYFDQKRALHGAYWRALFGYEQTHGCINLSIGDSHWLFDWAQNGDWVHVWDPSGKTPTDPAFYGEGGA